MELVGGLDDGSPLRMEGRRWRRLLFVLLSLMEMSCMPKEYPTSGSFLLGQRDETRGQGGGLLCWVNDGKGEAAIFEPGIDHDDQIDVTHWQRGMRIFPPPLEL